MSESDDLFLISLSLLPPLIRFDIDEKKKGFYFIVSPVESGADLMQRGSATHFPPYYPRLEAHLENTKQKKAIYASWFLLI